MNQLATFINKEWMENVRTGKLTICLIVYSIFGILNPFLAKITPYLMETLQDSLVEQGFQMSVITVNALTSWQQFYKNVSMMLIVFVILFSNSLTGEYSRGTLIHMLTKGLKRYRVILAKGVMMLILWTMSFWLSFGITYGYTVYFWDNSISTHFIFAGFCIFLFGIWLISLILLSSSLVKTNYMVLLFTGGAVAISYLLSAISKVADYLPTQLLNASSLLVSEQVPTDFIRCIIIICVLCAVNLFGAIECMNHKNLLFVHIYT